MDHGFDSDSTALELNIPHGHICSSSLGLAHLWHSHAGSENLGWPF